MTRHPSRRVLQDWLDTGGPGRVDRHVEHCETCQDDLDQLSALDEGVLSGLVAATEPPSDLERRVADGVDTRLRDEAAAGTFADLFTIGWDFLRCVIDPEPVTDQPMASAEDAAHARPATADENPGGTR